MSNLSTRAGSRALQVRYMPNSTRVGSRACRCRRDLLPQDLWQVVGLFCRALLQGSRDLARSKDLLQKSHLSTRAEWRAFSFFCKDHTFPRERDRERERIAVVGSLCAVHKAGMADEIVREAAHRQLQSARLVSIGLFSRVLFFRPGSFVGRICP